MQGQQQLEKSSLLIPNMPVQMSPWEYKDSYTPWVQRHSSLTHTETSHQLVLAGNLETLYKSQDLCWMVLRKDTFSTQDKLLHTKAINKELELTPGNGIMAKVELVPGNGIIPFCASKRCFSHTERQTAVLLAACHNQFLVSPEVRNTACKPVLCV